MRLLQIPAGLLCASLALAQAPQAAPRDPDVPFVPTPQEVVVAMLKLANVKPSDVVYDLGCGDGRIVITAAKDFGARAVGVDIDPVRIKEARHKAQQAGVAGRVTFREGDLFTADIHDATVVTLYLLPDINLQLRPKLQKELRPGTRIVSHSFDMDDWKPEKKQDIGGRMIYLWTIRAGGRPSPQ